jgi:hypothetical protein
MDIMDVVIQFGVLDFLNDEDLNSLVQIQKISQKIYYKK